MIDKIGHIKNPLSIIAIFAGIAEISGTIVLPFLDSNIQSIYVYFLMLFPSALVLMFFGTLWYRHQVLYAPSDYKDEENFTKWVKPASIAEVVQKKEQEKIDDDIKSEKLSGQEFSKSSDVNYRPIDTSSQPIFQRAFAEELAFKNLSDMYPDLVRNIKLGSPDERGVILDGAILKAIPTFIDVRTPNKLNSSYISATASKFIKYIKPYIPEDVKAMNLLMVYVAMDDYIDQSLPNYKVIGGYKIDFLYFKYSDLKSKFKDLELL